MELKCGDKIVMNKNHLVIHLEEDAVASGADKLWTAKAKLVQVEKERDVFLKYVVSRDKAGRAGLQSEAEFKMYHPNIATVYGGGFGVVSGGRYDERMVYCVYMEYIDGNDLFDYRIEKEIYEIDEEEMFAQMMQLLRGVQYYVKCCKRDPYVHRDLKPENIMIRKDKRVVIIDFDWMHNHNSNATIESAKKGGKGYAKFGTPGYTDPRLFTDWKTDLLMDIYSLGRVLFFWMAGEHYFSDEEKLLENYVKMAERNDPLLYGVEENRIPKEYRGEKYRLLIRMIDKMVASPKQRYTDIDYIIEDMKLFLKEYFKSDVDTYEEIVKCDELLEITDGTSDTKNENVLTITIMTASEGNYPHVIDNYQVLDLMKAYNMGMYLYNMDGQLKYLVYDDLAVSKKYSERTGKKCKDCWTNGKDEIVIRY